MKIRRLAFLLCLLLGSIQADADPSATPDMVRRPSGTVIIPEHFLRQWDPVTIFFDGDAGPAKPGPEDHPEKFLTMTPAHPGAFSWVDRHTLQFRPAVAWPAMGHFSWTVQGRKIELTTLMSAPIFSEPANGAKGLDPVEAITLRFSDPLSIDALAKLTTIELRPLPGIGGEQAHILDSHDFDVRPLERSRPADAVSYVLALHHPIPLGSRAIVHVRLSPDQSGGGEEQKISFSTAETFHANQFGCRDTSYPALPEGVSYSRERALTCPDNSREVVIGFSEQLAPIGPIEGRNLVRFSPQVDNLAFKTVANTLVVTGRFAADTLYQVRLEPAALKDVKGRPLVMAKPNQLYLSFPSQAGFVRWVKGEGIAERYGPQMVPVKARGVERVDLRIHQVDPLDRSLWPFPDNGVVLDETVQPPAPGEEPKAWSFGNDIGVNDIAAHIRAFGSPSLSELVNLPVLKGDTTSSFGLDLHAALTHVAGSGKPGHYLIGIRRLDDGSARQWMRLQVTDLSLTAVNAPHDVHFAVTSLSTGQPISGATVRLEGMEGQNWKVFASGTTGAEGQFDWKAPGQTTVYSHVRRVVVAKDDDVLVLDAAHPPREYAEGGWRDGGNGTYRNWLDWAFRDLAGRTPPAKNLCHIFTERPIYRPDDEVHIKGYVRLYKDGKLSIEDTTGTLVVEGPDGAEWRWPLALNEYGSFYHKFDEKTVATGTYKAYVEFKKDLSAPVAANIPSNDDSDDDDKKKDDEAESGDSDLHCHFVRFKKEAYRLPKFEVQLQSPLNSRLDAPFTVGLTAEYYAGGVVADRPLHWRVTQVPYNWMPKARPGFVFSADQRFSGNQPFRSSPVLERDEKTDDHGAARLPLDPTIEATAQPRKYIVEATVVGDDDQTVTNTQEVLALPPFVLGLKVPRFIEHGDKIEPVILVEDAQGKALAGQKVTVRLIRRQWNSILQASDFTQGSAKYVTEVIEDKVAETTVTSGEEPMKLSFPIKGAAVYLVEMESQDKLGRLQTVKVDLFAGGDRPATWSRPPAEVFSVAPDKTAYPAGETAKLVLQSPFQNATALAIVEQPDGTNSYDWVPVKNGYGTYALPIKPEFLPRVVVHFVLMRGRLKGGDDRATAHADLLKPASLAATQWVTVTPAKNIVKVELHYPPKALPGQDVSLTVKLADDQARPLSGEVTLWMVDQAVLSLAKEAKLDPLPQFIVPRNSMMSLRDSRNMAFGYLPLEEEPGGDEGDDGSPLLRSTVRKNFTPVPYYEPNLHVGPSGTVTVAVKLPDSLTNFKLRAKAVSGPDRFGFGTGDMQVRLPVIVQPALPRFVRPGDSFELSAIGRVVEGEGGAGRVQVKLDGLTLEGSGDKQVEWVPGKAQRVDFPVKVPTPSYGPDGKPGLEKIDVTVAVERSSDKARDAFQVSLPIMPDRDPIVTRTISPLSAEQPVTVPGLPEAVRPGSLKRDVLVTSRELAALAGGLDYLRRYPFGCTEQRISQARADIAARRFGKALEDTGDDDHHLDQSLQTTQTWIANAMDDHGLVAFWPGDRGYVSVTAWALQLLVEANAAGLTIDLPLRDKLIQSLRQSMRSDYRSFVDGQSWIERVWALSALTAAGQGDPSYAAELARKTQFLTLENQAQILWVLSSAANTPASTITDLNKAMWAGIITKLDHGHEVYGGLQEGVKPSGLILPSEARTVAQVLHASHASAPAEPRNRLLTEALIRLGQGDGWGSTNANAEAMLALADVIADSKDSGAEKRSVSLVFGGDTKTLSLSGPNAVEKLMIPAEQGSITTAARPEESLAVLYRSSYLPLADGSKAAASAEGFAVDREQISVGRDGATARLIPDDKPAIKIALTVGEVIEDHVVVVNSADRTHVVVVLPLAAGMEPLNPHLATSPPEAKPSQGPTLAPSYTAFLDDKVLYFYDELPKGAYHFRFRSRATVPGSFIQPPAAARAMYDDAVYGNGNGAMVVISRE